MICVAPSCQASFRSRTLLGDDTSLIFPVLSTLGRTNLGRRVGFRDSGFSLSEACTPSGERSRGFAEDPGVCVCACFFLSVCMCYDGRHSFMLMVFLMPLFLLEP